MTDQMPKPTGLSEPTVGNDDFFANRDYSQYMVPQQQPAAAETNDQQGAFGDAVDSFQRGIGQTVGGDLETAGQLAEAGWDGGQDAKKLGRAVSAWGDSQTQQMSQEGQDSLNKEWYHEDAEGNITAGDAMTDWRSWVNQGSTLVGQVASMVVGTKGAGLVARPLAKGAVKLAAKEAVEGYAQRELAKSAVKESIKKGALTDVRAALAAAPDAEAVNAVIKNGMSRLSAIGYGAHSTAMASGLRAQQARDEARDYWSNLPEDQLLGDERYQKAYWDQAEGDMQGADPTDIYHAAIDGMAEEAATNAWHDPRAMASDAVAGSLEGAFAGIGGLAGKIGSKTRLGAATKGFATEALGEGWQAGETQRAVNEAIQEWADESRDPMAGVFVQALTEATIAGPMGGVAGAIQGPHAAANADTKVTSAPLDNTSFTDVDAWANKMAGVLGPNTKLVNSDDAKKMIARSMAKRGASAEFSDLVAERASNILSGKVPVNAMAATPVSPTSNQDQAAADDTLRQQMRVLSGELGYDPFVGNKPLLQVSADNAPLALPNKDIIFAGDANAKLPGTEVAEPGAFDDKPVGPGHQFRGSERTRWQDGQEGEVLPPDAGNPAGSLPGRVIDGEAREVGTELPYKPFIAGQDNRAAVSEEQRRQAEQSAMAEQQQNQPKQIGQSDTIFAPGAPGADNKNSAYTPPRLSRDQVDNTLGEQSTRDPRSPVAQAIEQSGSEQDSIFGQLKTLRITKRGKPFASQKEAQLASRKTETPIELPAGGFGVVDKAELEQAIAAQGDVTSPANNTIALDVGEVKRPNGQIGNQGVSESQIIPLLNNVAGLSLPESATMRQAVDALKSDKTAQAKLREFTAANPIQAWEMPDGSISIQDGHHRAFLLDQLGDKTIPANIKDYTGTSKTYQPQENAGATQPVNQAPVKQPSSNAGQLGQSAEPTAPVMNEGVKQPEASQVKHDSNEAPGSDVGNGFKAGSYKGSRYRVGTTNSTGAENGTPIFEKRMPSGSAASFYVGKDGNLLDGDSVAFNIQSSKDRVWRPASKEQAAEAVSILDEMGQLDLNDPKRAELKVKLKALVLGETTSTIKPSMQAEASQNQSIRQADQTVKSIDHAKQNTAPAPDAGVSVSGAGKQRITIEPLTDKSIIVKGDKNDAELKSRVETAWPKAPPLYNERHKGWVFSSKREGVVRESLASLEQQHVAAAHIEPNGQVEEVTPEVVRESTDKAAGSRHFASHKEAQLASRKTETPIELPAGGFGVVDKAELEQAIAAQGDVTSPANNTIALDVGEVKRPNGQIGNQGVSESQIIPLLNNVAGLSLPESATMRQAVDALKSDKTAQAKLREFTAANPIQAWEMPDGSISIQDGHHRAFLLDQLGDKTIPANIKDYTGTSKTYQPQENAGATQPVNQAPVKQPSSNAGQLGQSAEPTAPVMNEGVKQPEASQVKHDSNEAPGSDVGNGFKAGSYKGSRYRVGTTNSTGAENGTPIFEKRMPSGSAASFYVGKDGNLLDGDSVAFNIQSSKDRVWRPASKEQAAEAVSILDEMGQLDLNDPKRAELKVKLKALVLGETTSTIKPSMQAEASQNQSIRQADQTVKSIDHAKQNTAPAPDAGVSVSGAGKQRITIEPLTDKSIIVKGDKNDAELKARVETAWPKAPPLYNERHKGWVFSSKREGVVRESLASLEQQHVAAAHIEPNGQVEEVTPEVVRESTDKAAGSRHFASHKEAWDWLNQHIDDAIAAAPDEASSGEFVTFDVPGDGKFKVVNSKSAIKKFASKARRAMTTRYDPMKTSGATDATPGWISRDSNSDKDNRDVVQQMLNDDDIDNAVSYAEATGTKLYYGVGGSRVNAYVDAGIAAPDPRLVTVRTQTGHYMYLHPETGMSAGIEKNLSDLRATFAKHASRLDAAIARTEKVDQAELQDRFLRYNGANDLADEIASKSKRHAADSNQSTTTKVEASGRQQTRPAEPAPALDATRFADNKLFTADRVAAARARIKSKLGTLNSGVDPEMLIDGMTIAGAYIEAGIRNFSAYAKAMTDDFGDGIKPYLLSFWEGTRHYPGLDTKGMTSVETSARQHAELMANTQASDQQAGQTRKQPDSEPNNKQGNGDKALSKKLRERLFLELDSERIEIKGNNDLKAIVAQIAGVKPAEVTPLMLKRGQEAYEVAAARVRREQITHLLNTSNGERAAFDYAVQAYSDQPNLDVRTANSSNLQAYSTPTPLALLANLGAGIHSGTTVYEPTAGNGLLLLTADTGKTYANELDPDRAEALAWSGFNTTVLDATNNPFEGAVGGEVDAVVANPPFGKLRDDHGKPTKYTFTDDQGREYNFGEIDHVIAKQALDAMKDDGKASLILGAAKEPGDYTGNNKQFLNWLYSNYNVVQHVEADGNLYKGQGAAWPVQLIVIHGRSRNGTGKFAPFKGDVKRLDNWGDLYAAIENHMDTKGATYSQAKGAGNVLSAREPAANPRERSRSDQGWTGVDDRGRTSSRADKPGRSTGAAARGKRKSGAGTDGTFSSQPDINEDRLEPTASQSAADQRGTVPRGQSDNLGLSGQRNGDAVADQFQPRELDAKVNKANEYQANYQTASNGFNDAVLTPVNMASSTQLALMGIQDKHGSVDGYVADRLGYASSGDLYGAFMGLQVDAVAMAVDNIERGRAIIIGDQTGVGKGRQAAGIIRYAMQTGKIPVFVTQKPNLFTDMYDDLHDIGVESFKPLIMNQDNGFISKGDDKLFDLPANERSRLLNSISVDGKLPDGYDALFLTYSQISSETSGNKLATLQAIMPNALLVMDESHTAAGIDSKLGLAFQYLVDNAAGVTYLSATYAKRPDNMALYSRTDLGLAVTSREELVGLVKAGGIGMQTYIAGKLAEAGQMVRRERSFDGISINNHVIEDPDGDVVRQFDAVTEALRAIQDLSKAWRLYLELELAKEIQAESGMDTMIAGNQADTKINVALFSSVVHNYIAQLSLGLKAKQCAQLAIKDIKEGRRPVIALENTMSSALETYMELSRKKMGDSAKDLTYGSLLKMLADGALAYSVKAPGAKNGIKKMVPIGSVDNSLVRSLYERVEELADQLDVTVPASPIDAIRYELEKAGLSVAEITGRSTMIDYSDNATIIPRPKNEMDRRHLVDLFNAGKLDVMILNQAGSTGLSLHASSRYKDQRQRHMIVAQPSLDINTFMQMLGRVNRTGQVVPPAYDVAWLDLPSEKRPMAVLARKLASLNANTSGNTESATSIDSVDLLNVYGDQVVAEYVEENANVLRQYSHSLVSLPTEDQANYFMGKLAVMPVKVQEEVLMDVEGNYRDMIAYLDATGQNELNMTELDLDAKPLEQMRVSEGDPKSGVFAEPTYLTKVNCKANGRAPSWAEVQDELAKSSQEDFDAIAEQVNGETKYAEKLQEQIAKLESKIAKLNSEGKKSDGELAAKLNKEQELEEFEAQRRNITAELGQRGMFHHGAVLRVRLPDYEHAVTGVVTSIKYTHAGGNPAARSKFKIGIMVADRIRSFPLALSKVNETIEGARYESEANLKSIFDRASEMPSREQRYIMTGNLVEAQSRTSDRGRIVAFTTADGRVIQGMLMPKKFSPANMRGKANVDHVGAFAWLENTTDAQAAMLGLSTIDGDVILRRRRSGNFEVEMPKSVSKGKRYWGDPRMVAIIGEQAVKGGGKMQIQLNASDAKKVCDAISAINPLSIRNQIQIKDYNAMNGNEEPTFDSGNVLFSLSDAAPNTRGMTKPELEMVVTDWSKQYKGAASARILVVANKAEMNEVLGMVGAAVPDGKSVNAAYLPGYKTLLLNAEAIQNPKRARELMRHELLAHHGLREVVGDDAYISIIEAVKRGKDIGGIKDAYYQVAENYTDMHPDVQAEEVFAHWMETQPDRGELAVWWRGIVRRVKDALRAVGLVGERTTEEEFNRVLDAIVTGMRNGRRPGRRVMESWHEAPAYSKSDALFSLGSATADQSIIGKAESLAKAAPSSVLNWIKEQRGVGLGALTDLQIDQIYRGVTGGAVSRYQKLRANMEADRNDILLDAETRIDPLWDALGKEQKKALSNLMHDATMARLHPDQSLADNSLYQEVKQKLERATKPSTKDEYQSELDTIIANHKHLAERYNLGLNKEGKALYQTMRETYDKQWADLRDAIEQRLEDMMGAEGKTLAAELRLQMEHALKHGPYFPLARFGDYVVKASKGDEHIREHFERRKDAEQAIKQYQRDGYNAVMTVKEEGNGGQANSNALGMKVMQLLDKAGESGASASAIKDDVWQAMLQMLPDASFAKHAIHRRRVKGASRDGHRAYLNSVYHYAHHVSKIRYGHKMQAELNKMNEQIQAGVRGEESNIKPEDLEVAQQVLNEMNKRHELNMNPKGAKWTGWAGNLGFMWYMAGSPASAIINMTQNFTVMLPQLGAKYGFGKASAAMVKAMFDYGKHGKFKAGTKEAWVSLTRADSGITSDEKALLNSLYKAGALDLTQAHSVAARADTDLQDVKPGAAWKRKTMAWLGSMFHNAEVLNREVAALAAYRLLKSADPSLSPEQYADQVTEMVYDGHGNYAASNRPRYMRGDIAKVMTQFKIYSQLMTYTLYRNAYLAAKGDRVALKTLGGILGTHFVMAGVMGLPYPVTMAVYAIASAFDDDDDREGEASFRLGLTEVLGKDLGELVARGPMDAMTGLSIAGRTGINGLWYRDPEPGAEGDDLAWHITQQIIGPVPGIFTQALRGLSMMGDGDYQRGAETMMPKALKDVAKAYRQASEGERTRKGDIIIDDVDAFNVAMQVMGFGSAEMAKVYDAREYIKGKEGRIEDERSKLMSDYFMARKDGDEEAMADVMAQIREFNASHYRTEAITSRTLRQSLKSKQRSAHRTQGGVYLSRNREYLRGEGAFVGDDGTATN